MLGASKLAVFSAGVRLALSPCRSCKESIPVDCAGAPVVYLANAFRQKVNAMLAMLVTIC